MTMLNINTNALVTLFSNTAFVISRMRGSAIRCVRSQC